MSIRGMKDRDKGYKALLKNIVGFKKKTADVGVFADKKNKEGMQIAEYATANEFGAGRIPERSFMRSTYDEKIEETKKLMRKYILSYLLKIGSGKIEYRALKVGAAYMSAMIKEKISTSKSWAKPNSPLTIALKSKGKRIKDTPLINTGALRNSITYKIR